ncbi:disease resistance protein RPV1-like [Pyrus x bretschneideri]|uniref:disease resistance protein RPV1-like n=1 Tax=Pyrus x bretschneideri TaxID=225117 RepID=UPI00202E4973|nr:disease resistance protein RPV1-like [Pyrus x bretschneideri]
MDMASSSSYSSSSAATLADADDAKKVTDIASSSSAAAPADADDTKKYDVFISFRASSVLKNVRENSKKPNGLDHLVKTLLKEILKEENLSMESTFVQDRLRRTKVLIVLDDVSNSMQMQHLAGNRLRYGSGSRIIITSRDRSTLRQIVEVDKIYEVEGLQPDDAVQLFCSCAFKDNSTRRTYYKELVEKAVHYAGRVPLALIEITNIEAIQVNWYNLQEQPLKRVDLKKMSNLIMLSSFGKLTASLDLPDSLILVNLQVIYMDGSAYLTEVPNLSGSLKIVEITLRGCEKSLKYLPEMPGNIQYLNLECSGIKELPESVWSNENISYLNLRQCKDLKILPSSKCKLKNLEKLDLNLCSKFENLPEVLEPMEHLKSLSLIETAVTELPSSICKLKYLESEILKPMEHLGYLCLHCTAVEMLPSSIGNLNRLQDLNLSGCDQLKDVPTTIYRLTNLKCL